MNCLLHGEAILKDGACIPIPRVIHGLRIEGTITELYDVGVLPGVQRPMALGFQTDEIAQILTLDPMGEL